jgi:hypothetical protein
MPNKAFVAVRRLRTSVKKNGKTCHVCVPTGYMANELMRAETSQDAQETASSIKNQTTPSTLIEKLFGSEGAVLCVAKQRRRVNAQF